MYRIMKTGSCFFGKGGKEHEVVRLHPEEDWKGPHVVGTQTLALSSYKSVAK